jgi:hypothetical protein
MMVHGGLMELIYLNNYSATLFGLVQAYLA